jgi:hypothetical protein
MCPVLLQVSVTQILIMYALLIPSLHLRIPLSLSSGRTFIELLPIRIHTGDFEVVFEQHSGGGAGRERERAEDRRGTAKRKGKLRQRSEETVRVRR